MIIGVLLGLVLIMSGVLPDLSYIIIPIGLGAIILILLTRYIGKWWFQRKVRSLIILCKEFIGTDKESDTSKNLSVTVGTLEKARKDGDVAKVFLSYRALKRAWGKITKDSGSTTSSKSKQKDPSSVRARKARERLAILKWSLLPILIIIGLVVSVFRDGLFPTEEVLLSNYLVDFPPARGIELTTLHPGNSCEVRLVGTWRVYNHLGNGYITINCQNGDQPKNSRSDSSPNGALPYKYPFGYGVFTFNGRTYGPWSTIRPKKSGALVFDANVPYGNVSRWKSVNSNCRMKVSCKKRIL